VNLPHLRASACVGLFGPIRSGKSFLIAEMMNEVGRLKIYRPTNDVSFHLIQTEQRDLLFVDTPGWDCSLPNFGLDTNRVKEEEERFCCRLVQWFSLQLIDYAIIFMTQCSLETIQNITRIYSYLKRANPAAQLFLLHNFEPENIAQDNKWVLNHLSKFLCPDMKIFHLNQRAQAIALIANNCIGAPSIELEQRVDEACSYLSSWLRFPIQIREHKLICTPTPYLVHADCLPPQSAELHYRYEGGIIDVELPGLTSPIIEIRENGVQITGQKYLPIASQELFATIPKQDFYDVTIPFKVTQIKKTLLINGVLRLFVTPQPK